MMKNPNDDIDNHKKHYPAQPEQPDNMFDPEGKTPEEMLEHIRLLEQKVVKLINANKDGRKYKELFNESQRIGKIGTWEIDTGINNMTCSNAFFDIHELTHRKKLTFDDYTEMIAIEDRLKVITTITKAVQDRKRFRIEYKVKIDDGTFKYVYTEGETKYNKRGQPDSIIGITQDITDRKLVEESLRKSEALYKLLFNGSTDPIFIRYIERDKPYEPFLEINEAAVRVFEYTRDEIRHLTEEDIYSDNEKHLLPERESELLAKGMIRYVADMSTRSGRLIKAEVHAQIINIRGHLTSYTVVRDITRRYMAESSLRKSEAALMNFATNTNSIIFTTDEKGILTLVTGKGLVEAGFAAEDFLGKTPVEIMGADSEFAPRFREALEGKSGKFVIEYKHTIFEVEVSHISDSEGNFAGLTGLLNNITERITNERKLRESENQFRVLTEYSLIGVYITDNEKFLYVNPAFAQIMGYEPHEIINKIGPGDFVHPEDYNMVLSESKAFYDMGKDQSHLVYRGIHKDGRVLVLEVLGRSIEFNGRLTVMGTVRDITESTRADKLKRIRRDLVFLLSKETSLQGALNVIIDTILRVEEIDCVSVYLFDNESGTLKLADNKGLSEEYISVSSEYAKDSYLSSLFKSGRPVYTTLDRITPMMNDIRANEGIKTMALIPIVQGGICFGGIVAYSRSFDDISDDIRYTLEAAGEHVGVFVTGLRTRRELEKNEAFMRSVADSLPQAVYIYDLVSGENIFSNRDLTALLGYTEEEVKSGGSGFTNLLFHPNDMAVLTERLERLDKAADNEDIETQFRMLGKNGYYRWVHTKELVFERAEDGKPIKILGSASDITEHKLVEEQIYLLNVELENRVLERTAQIESANIKLEQEILERHRIEAILRESEEKYRTVVENATDGILVVRDKTIKYINYQAASILNLNYEKIKDKEIDWFVLPEDLKMLFSGTITSTGNAYINSSKRLFISDKHGNRKWIECRFVIFPDHGSESVLSFMNDISERIQYEREIDESREKMRILINATNDIIFLSDLEGNVITHNHSTLSVLNTDKTDITGENIFKLLDSDISVIRKKYFDEAILTNRPVSWSDENRHQFRDNIVYPVPDASGKPVRAAIFSTDITEKKRSELAVRESEERFRTLADIAPVLIWMAGTDQSYIYFNRYWLDFTGRSFEAEFGFGWTGGIHPEDYSACMLSIESAFEEKRILQHEYRLRRYDGEYRWILDTAKPRVTKDGTFVGYIGSCVDITERKNAESRIRETNERFMTVLESLDAWVYASDMKTRELVYVSKVIRDELGDVTGRNCCEALRQGVEFGDKCRNCTNDFLLDENGNPKEVYVWEYFDKVRKKWFQCHDRAIRWNDGRMVKLQIATDITELKSAELTVLEALDREKELNNLKSRFISMVSHEYRTPLTVILSSAEILEDLERSIDPDSYAKYIDKIKTSVERMTGLLEDILIYGKIDSGKVNMQVEQLDIIKLINNIIEEINQIDRNRHRISFEKHGEKFTYFGDERLTHQVLSNLVSNAVKYSPEGTDVIVAVDYEDSQLIISITDSGIGIDREDIDKLFVPFHRGKNVENIPGTGFGLAIVKRALELLRGEIEVVSEIGKGSKFIVTL